jgi:hypothetical protein
MDEKVLNDGTYYFGGKNEILTFTLDYVYGPVSEE